MKVNEVSEYIQECLRLLYWVYFKPYTLTKWLQDIHPELDRNTNPFSLRSEFERNTQLKSYADLFLFLTIIPRILATFVFVTIYYIFEFQSFKWLIIGIFLARWIIPLFIQRLSILDAIFLIWGTLFIWKFIFIISPTPTQTQEIIESIQKAAIFVSIAITGLVGISSSAYIILMLRICLWIPELIWMMGLRVLVSQGNSVLLMRRLPLYFDQLIFLPLPFMAKIIIEAHRQNPIAARSTVNYFITSTNQQTVAKQAMFGIGIDIFKQCRYVSDIIGSQVQLDWLPTDDEKTFGKVIPRLLEISHNIDIAHQATTAYNKLELVDRSIADLQKLQTSLSTAASASDAPLFGTITTRWLQILQDNRQALKTAAQASAEIPNPYLASDSLEPADAKERFKGRQDLFREIEKISLSAQPPILLLYGRRKTGKTSSLKYLPSRVSSDLIPLLVDFQGAAMIQRMENVAGFMAEAMTKTAKSSRNLILPKISPEQLSSDPFYALQTWMDQIEQVAPNKRFLLCIDEFERLQEVISTSGSRAPLNFLRYVTQNCRQWIVLFSGSHRLEELDPYWSDCLIGTRTLSITYLQEAEARELIQHPVATFPDIYSSDAVDEILSLTHRQPYLVQLLCSCIVEYINDAKRKSVTVSDVEAAKPIAWERGEGYFKEFSDALTPAQRDFIHRLLAHETPKKNDLMVIRQLIQSEIIEKDVSGEYRFQVPLIKQYMCGKSLT
jgi:uncharacterized protein